MGCASSKTTSPPPNPSQKFLQAQPVLPQGFHGNFPSTFKFFYTGRKKLRKTDFFALVSEVAGEQTPLHVATFHTGNLDLKRQVTLYTGTERDTEPLATAGSDSAFGKYAFVTLPGDRPGGGNRTETIVWPSNFPTQSYEVPVGSSRTLETFEWRGNNMTWASGSNIKPWNLVRVRAGADEETVATWTELPFRTPTGEMGTFQFLGSGATGELGKDWTLMTVTSWLWLFEQRYAINRFMGQSVGADSGLAFFGLGMI